MLWLGATRTARSCVDRTARWGNNSASVITRVSFSVGARGGTMATKEEQIGGRRGLALQRYFTRDGVHPFDEVEWETRDAVIPNYKEGGNAFEQRGVEFPKGWSQN